MKRAWSKVSKFEKDGPDVDLVIPPDIEATIFDPLRFSLVLTLKHMTAVKIVSQLWITKDIRDKTAEFDPDSNLSLLEFMKFSQNIEESVSKLPLPLKVSSHLKSMVRILASEIFLWIVCQLKLDNYFKPWNYFNCIQWNPAGRIKGGKTAELIISKMGINKDYRQSASQYYCLNLSSKRLLKQAIDNCFTREFHEDFLIATDDDEPIFKMKREDTSLDSFEFEARSNFIKVFNDGKDAIDGGGFFVLCMFNEEEVLRKLWTCFTEENKAAILKNYRDAKSADFLCFILSEMDGETQLEYFKRHKVFLLGKLFQDPLWHNHFLSTGLRWFPFLTSLKMCMLLMEMATIMEELEDISENRKTYIKMLHQISSFYTLKDKDGEKLLFHKVIMSLYEHSKDIVDLLLTLIDKSIVRDYVKSFTCYAVVHIENDDELILIKHVVQQLLKDPNIIEKFFIEHNCLFASIKILLDRYPFSRLISFITIFLFDETLIASLIIRISRFILHMKKLNYMREARYKRLSYLLELHFPLENDVIHKIDLETLEALLAADFYA